MTKELAYRQNDGIDVTLLWHSDDDSVVVSIHDAKSDYAFEVGVPRDRRSTPSTTPSPTRPSS